MTPCIISSHSPLFVATAHAIPARPRRLGEYTIEDRRGKIERFLRKKRNRSNQPKNIVKYQCRKKFADARPRVHGRFVPIFSRWLMYVLVPGRCFSREFRSRVRIFP